MFDISRRYRTIHSLRDHEVEAVFSNLPADARVVLDYGCHMGHLSIEMAIQRDMVIFAVDNFKGSEGDDLMAKTVSELTEGRMDFYANFVANTREAERLAGGFRGRIIPLRTEDFFRLAAAERLEFDFAFIDSSHREEEAQEFRQIADLIKPGCILGGHDNDAVHSRGVVEGIKLIEHEFDWYCREYTWFMRKQFVQAAASSAPTSEPAQLAGRAGRM